MEYHREILSQIQKRHHVICPMDGMMDGMVIAT